ncbi:MAG: hypothetical protein WCY26_10985, partial [Thiohalobacteraceae bacterium]
VTIRYPIEYHLIYNKNITTYCNIYFYYHQCARARRLPALPPPPVALTDQGVAGALAESA